MGGACGTYGGKERCIQGFVWGDLKAERPLGRRRRRWEDNIKTDSNNESIGRVLDLSGLG